MNPGLFWAVYTNDAFGTILNSAAIIIGAGLAWYLSGRELRKRADRDDKAGL